jgi:carboxypeptidase family protein/TonB-dependent receptor-like protein
MNRWTMSAVLVLLLIPSLASAQATSGEITGRVEDSGGAIVPGVTVSAENRETGYLRTTLTNAQGEYLITLLPPGRYNVSAELEGFKRAVREGVSISVGTRQTLNLLLEVGGITEQVLVSGATPLIDTTRSEIAGVVTARDIANLPALNRTFANLAMTMPEARPAGGFDPTKTRVGNFAMNGGDGRQLDVNVDGGDNKDNVVGSLLQNYAYESVQEFQVLQHRWSAEAGRSVGGVVNVVSKSGTNDLRGSGFFTFRNDDMLAKDFFQARGTVKPPFERKEYGGSVGGPLVRDRLFFFGALERFDEPKSAAPIRSQAIYNELAAIPGSNPVQSIETPYDDTLMTVKVDQRLNASQNLLYRFSLQKNSSPNDQVANPATTDLSGGNTDTNDLYDFVGKHTYSLGGNRLNDFTFHFQDFNNEILQVTDDPIRLFATPNLRVGPAPNTPQQTTARKFQFRDDFTWFKGDHGLKFGTNYIHTNLGGYFYFGAFGHELAFFDDPSVITTNLAKYPQGFQTPGAVQRVSYYTGSALHDQTFHQLAFYAQDDWRISPKLTLNLGVRWDANIGLLPDQTSNRTIALLKQLDDPRARAITSDADKLARTTPSWKEYQPRLGFAYDVTGDASLVVRGGYGLFFDQLFQNLTLFSMTQSGPEFYAEVMRLTNNSVGVGQLPNFRYGVDPLPAPPTVNFAELPVGTFGRINDPDASDPYVQKFSIGFEKILRNVWVLSSDYVHTDGFDEGRVQVINPLIRSVCDAAFPGSTPSDARCVAGASTRYFDAAFVRAGLGVNRLSQINMIGTTNESKYDSLTTTLRGRLANTTLSVSYVLANSRAWGGQPTASYSGNGIAVRPEVQFNDEEWGPTRHDERHRVVASGVVELPMGFQVSPIVQLASSRPYTLTTGADSNGDGLISLTDRLCEGVSPEAVFAARGNSAAINALNPNGCRLSRVNQQRSGFVVNPDGSIDERSGRFFNTDLRITKNFGFNQRVLRVYVDFYNLFNTENLSFTLRPEESRATSASGFMQPVSLYGPGFGPPVGRPFTASIGARFEF